MMSVSQEMKWFFIFFCYFAMTTHVVACFWIIAGDFESDVSRNNSWVYKYTEYRNSIDDDTVNYNSDLYLTSFYFTITTITTVGYGDFSATTFNEKIINIFIMIIGVIAFSMASGALTNYIA